MKKYEITFVIGEALAEDKAKEVSKNVRELIEGHGGKIDVDLFWGKKKLVYKIEKNTFGYYFVIVFFIDPKKISELNKELRMNDKLIRYLVVDFVEKTPFFEEVAERKARGVEGRSPRKEDDVIEENIKKSARKKKEATVEEEKVEEKEDNLVVAEASEEIKNQSEKEEKEEAKETIEKIDNPSKEENIDVEIETDKEAGEVEEKAVDVQPKKEEKKEKKSDSTPEPKKEEDFAERKPEKKTMSDDERKAQLEQKLAELLKEEYE